eukprot:TRINITY_DN2283_c0_g1_i1.p1 TRINITY_DN2283_c0_g1~~TRINITY_DN2283_c0_g1_i1.p1  ORF type:complete len:263 (+),score=21.79 TRINITY_DN2283_c0_g1_i1:547-1335(+)
MEPAVLLRVLQQEFVLTCLSHAIWLVGFATRCVRANIRTNLQDICTRNLEYCFAITAQCCSLIAQPLADLTLDVHLTDLLECWFLFQQEVLLSLFKTCTYFEPASLRWVRHSLMNLSGFDAQSADLIGFLRSPSGISHRHLKARSLAIAMEHRQFLDEYAPILSKFCVSNLFLQLDSRMVCSLNNCPADICHKFLASHCNFYVVRHGDPEKRRRLGVALGYSKQFSKELLELIMMEDGRKAEYLDAGILELLTVALYSIGPT